MTALTVYGVFAPEKRTAIAVNAGGTAEGMPFVPNDGMMGNFLFCSKSFRRNENESTTGADQS